jgi:ubiquinone/menaquinone biosynthesis C-methylase UbiE
VDLVNTEQEAFWSEFAPIWVELEAELEQIAGPPGRLAMDRLHLAPGQRVIDLGCGIGTTTVELAGRVSPGGEVLGVDIAEPMLDGGRERVAALALDNVSFLHADVQAHDLGGAQFDAAYSRFGVMFFADPVAAFTNVRRALRPGGRLSFASWQSVFDNEWMLIPGAAIASVTGIPPQLPGPGSPGPFSLADADHVASVLKAAGFQHVDIVPHADTVVLTEEQIPARARTSMRTGAGREALRDADEETRARALVAIEDALRARLHDGEVRVSRGVLLVGADG